MSRILLTNDDGIHAAGIKALEAAVAAIGEVYVVAPLTEQSAASRAITVRHPLRYREFGPRHFAVEGTPTDSIMLGLAHLLDFRPDLVISGINNGPNLGENIFYSGTVAAAAEGARHGIPAIAMSVTERVDIDYSVAAGVAARLAKHVVAAGLPAGVALNVNVPHPSFDGIEITRQSPKISRNVMLGGQDPYGRPYFWMPEEVPLDIAEPGTDYAAVREGKVSVTPMRFDYTAGESSGGLAGELKDQLSSWVQSW